MLINLKSKTSLPKTNSIQTVYKQYYLSDSNTELVGGEWQNSLTSIPEGKYCWTRDVYVYTNGTVKHLNVSLLINDYTQVTSQKEYGYTILDWTSTDDIQDLPLGTGAWRHGMKLWSRIRTDFLANTGEIVKPAEFDEDETYYTFSLTTDTTFQTGKNYYVVSGEVYKIAEVEEGEEIPLNTYYEEHLVEEPVEEDFDTYFIKRETVPSIYGSWIQEFELTDSLERNCQFAFSFESNTFVKDLKSTKPITNSPYQITIVNRGYGDFAPTIEISYPYPVDSTKAFISNGILFIKENTDYERIEVTLKDSRANEIEAFKAPDFSLSIKANDITKYNEFYGSATDYPENPSQGDSFNLIGDGIVTPYTYDNDSWIEITQYNHFRYSPQASQCVSAYTVLVGEDEYKDFNFSIDSYKSIFSNSQNIQSLASNKIELYSVNEDKMGDIRSHGYTTGKEDRENRNLLTDEFGYIIDKDGNRIEYSGSEITLTEVKAFDEDEYQLFLETCTNVVAGSFDKGQAGFYVSANGEGRFSEVYMRDATIVGGTINSHALISRYASAGEQVEGVLDSQHYLKYSDLYGKIVSTFPTDGIYPKQADIFSMKDTERNIDVTSKIAYKKVANASGSANLYNSSFTNGTITPTLISGNDIKKYINTKNDPYGLTTTLAGNVIAHNGTISYKAKWKLQSMASAMSNNYKYTGMSLIENGVTTGLTGVVKIPRNITPSTVLYAGNSGSWASLTGQNWIYFDHKANVTVTYSNNSSVKAWITCYLSADAGGTSHTFWDSTTVSKGNSVSATFNCGPGWLYCNIDSNAVSPTNSKHPVSASQSAITYGDAGYGWNYIGDGNDRILFLTRNENNLGQTAVIKKTIAVSDIAIEKDSYYLTGGSLPSSNYQATGTISWNNQYYADGVSFLDSNKEPLIHFNASRILKGTTQISGVVKVDDEDDGDITLNYEDSTLLDLVRYGKFTGLFTNGNPTPPFTMFGTTHEIDDVPVTNALKWTKLDTSSFSADGYTEVENYSYEWDNKTLSVFQNLQLVHSLNIEDYVILANTYFDIDFTPLANNDDIQVNDIVPMEGAVSKNVGTADNPFNNGHFLNLFASVINSDTIDSPTINNIIDNLSGFRTKVVSAGGATYIYINTLRPLSNLYERMGFLIYSNHNGNVSFGYLHTGSTNESGVFVPTYYPIVGYIPSIKGVNINGLKGICIGHYSWDSVRIISVESANFEIYSSDSSTIYPIVSNGTVNDTNHPVGSIYISVDSTSPASLFGGSWSQIDEGYALWTVTSGAGNYTDAGLPNITGSFISSGGGGGAMVNTGEAYGYGPDAHSYAYHPQSMSFYASSGEVHNGSYRNDIYGKSDTVKPPAYTVYAWVRTA